jgi:dCTP deaminase
MLSDILLIEAMKSGALRIAPEPAPEFIQPASIDMTLGDEWATFQDGAQPWIDAENREAITMHRWRRSAYMLPPLSFALAHTEQSITLDKTLVARVEGKSTLGRLGLMVHVSAGFIDPGFSGVITLELFNCTRLPIRLVAGMKICQVAISRLEAPASRGYGSPGLGSHYQGQTGAQPAR